MAGIYLLQTDDQLIEMREHAYDSEDLLQALLAKYPNLLAGDQIDSIAPRRWLLVTREAAVPSEEGGSGRWAADHLFLDQDAIPTIVEVKRSGDTRIRREVIGQMLEYAANAVVYWPIDALRARFEANCEMHGVEPQQAVQDFIGPDGDTEHFWQATKTNLQAGKVRLVFVADVIPPELRRIVEFLNGQMDPAEVLAVEVRQYVGPGQKALVPRVFGQTAQALQKKTPGSPARRKWDEASFLEALGSRDAPAVPVARAILDWARARRLRVWWGNGARDGSFSPMIDHGAVQHGLVSVWTYGRVEVQFEMMKARRPFDDESKRQELLHRLNEVPEIVLPLDSTGRRPSFKLATLGTGTSLSQFLEVLDWVIHEVRGL